MAWNWFRRTVFDVSPFLRDEGESHVIVEYRWKLHTITSLRYTAVVFEVQRHRNPEGEWVFEPSKEAWTSAAKKTPMEARKLASEYLGLELTKDRMIHDYSGPPFPISVSWDWDW